MAQQHNIRWGTALGVALLLVAAAGARRATEGATCGDGKRRLKPRSAATLRTAVEVDATRGLSVVSGKNKVQPHVVFILIDDLGWSDIGYQNKKYDNVMRSPHMDELAAQGVKFDHYYVQSVCTPTRAVLLTGKYLTHTGMQHSIVQSGQPRALGREHATIAEKLKPLGYSTHMVGKWHLGYYKKEFTPPQRGFDTFFGFWNGLEGHYNHSGTCDFAYWICPGCGPGLDFYEQDTPFDPKGEYSTDILTRRAVEVIRTHNASTPLFLYLPYQAMHHPLEAPQDVIDRFSHVQDEDRRIYAAMLAKLDEGVANVTKALKESGLYDDTVIIVSTDNGGDIHHGAANYPLRGWKGSFWEAGIRAIGFVHSPLLEETGVTRHGLMHVSDWFPTLLRLATFGTAAGAPNMSAVVEQGIDGLDQWDHISRGAASPRTEILHNIDPIGLDPDGLDPISGTKQSAIRVGAFKLLLGNPGQNLKHDGWIPPPGFTPPPYTGKETAECQPCKFTAENLTTGICLFNIESDPTERCNLAPSRPDVVARLLQRLQEHNATAVPATYPGPSDYCNPNLYDGKFAHYGDIHHLP